MTSKVEWLIQDKILVMHHQGKFEIADAHFLIEECQQYLDQATQPIHIIVDHTQTTGITSDLHQLNSVRAIATPFFTHENLGTVVNYGIESKLLRFLATMAGQLNAKSYQSFQSKEDALQHLAHNHVDVAKHLQSL